MTKKILLSVMLAGLASSAFAEQSRLEIARENLNTAIEEIVDAAHDEGMQEGMAAGIKAEEAITGEVGIENPEEVAEEAVEIEENMEELLNNPEELNKIMEDPEFKSFMEELQKDPKFAEQLAAVNDQADDNDANEQTAQQ